MSTRVVWKFPLLLAPGPQEIDMPKGAEIVLVHMQAELCFLWAVVNPAADPEPRGFIIHGTGHQMDHDGQHVGSVMDGVFVWHVFELRSPDA